MREDDRIRIRHMIEAGEAALEFSRGRERDDLDTDRMLLFAVVRALEIIGEAASRLSEETRAIPCGIPWKHIVGMRNRIIHAYWEIDRDIVWKTIREEVPELLDRLRSFLAQDRDAPGSVPTPPPGPGSS